MTMNESRCKQSAPFACRMRVGGHLDLYWSTWFDGMAITHEADGTTLLVGLLVDQAALFGLLGAARDLNLTVLSFQLKPNTMRSSIQHERRIE